MKINEAIQPMLDKLATLNLGSHINLYNELIFIPKTNLYILLNDVNTEFDFKCKLLEWCSRDCCKGVNKYWRQRTREMVNYLLNTTFTELQFSKEDNILVIPSSKTTSCNESQE